LPGCVKLDHFHIFKLFTFPKGVLNLGKEENVTWGHVWGVWGGRQHSLACTVLFKDTAQVGLGMPKHCHNKFSIHQTVIFLVVYSKLHHKDVSVVLNNNDGLWFRLGE
jgi:hypothetical protein